MDKLRTYAAREWKYYLLAAGFSLVLCLLCLPVGAFDCIAYDSSYQYALTRHSLPEIWALIPADFSPPLYTLLLKAFTLIAGDSLFSMRLFNALLLIGMEFIALFPIRRAFDLKTAVGCAVGFTCTTLNMDFFIHEIRPTVLGYFTITGAVVYGYLAFYQEKRRDLVIFTLFCIAAMYTHNIALLAVVAFYIVLLVAALIRRDFSRVRRFFISGVVAAVSYLPWLSVILHQLDNVRNHYWNRAFSGVDFFIDNVFDKPFDSYLTIRGAEIIWGVFKFIALVYILRALDLLHIEEVTSLRSFRSLPVFDRKKTWDRFSPILFLFCLLAAALLFYIALLLLVCPVQTERYLYMFTAIPILMLSVFIVRSELKWAPAVVTVLLVCNAGINCYAIHKNFRETNFRDMVGIIRAEHPDGNISFVHDHEASLGIMIYYFPEAHHYIHDDTHTVLTTFDVFPCEVTNLGDPDNIREYTDTFYLFDNYMPDSVVYCMGTYKQSDDYTCEPVIVATDLFSYVGEWRLTRVDVTQEESAP